LGNYLRARMFSLAPNLASLTGEIIGARLIARAGSLLGLSKMSASTIQIIGAEKALFRAIKTKRDTPKYGLIYHAQIISTVPQKLKGKVARMLANKASLAVRYDALSEHTDDGDMNILGLEQRAILEKRIKALETEITHQATKTKKVRFRETPSIIHGGGEFYDTSADFTLPRKRKHENDNASEFIETKKLKLTSILKDEKKERSKKLTIQQHQLAGEAEGYKVEKKMKKEKHLKEESVFMEQPAVESFVEQEEMVESSVIVEEDNDKKKKKKKKKRTSDSADITLESVEALGEIKTEPQLEIVQDVNVKKKKRKRKSGEEIESSEKKITVKEEKEEKRKDDDGNVEEEDTDLKNLSQELSVKSKKKKKMKKHQMEEEEHEAKEEQHLYGEEREEEEEETGESKLNLSTQSIEKKKKKKKKKKNDSVVEE
ncbi:Nucleolar protein 58, partial [Trichinella spiralis]